MRVQLFALWMLLCAALPASAQTFINFSTPGVRISVNVPLYPTLQRVPGYPVYYAPSLNSNYFFYDGMYWVYESDNWYASSWYNGPWWVVNPMDVPLYLLRVPVRYYRQAPAYFRGWASTEMPRWGDHWGSAWQQRRSGWNQWDRSSSPAPAPLPSYQRQYSGKQYPQASQQAFIQTRDYRYQPNDAVAQQNFQHQRSQAQAASPVPPAGRRDAVAPQQQPQPPRAQASVQPPASAPRGRDQRGNEPRAIPPTDQRGQAQPAPVNRDQPVARPPARSQQAPRNVPAPANNEPQASPPPAPRGERRANPTPANREQPAASPRQPPQQSQRPNPPQANPAPAPQQPQRQAERPNPPQAKPAPPVAKPPARPNDQPDKNQGNDKGNDGEKEKKGRDRV
jgi:hypothetical protein